MASSEVRMVTLISSEEEAFTLPEEAASAISELVKDTTADCDDTDLEMQLPRVGTECLRRIVDFMNQNHQEKMMEIPTPLNGNTFEEVGN